MSSDSLVFEILVFKHPVQEVIVILESFVIVISDSKVILGSHFVGRVGGTFCRPFWKVTFFGHFWSLKIVFRSKFWCVCSGDIINS